MEKETQKNYFPTGFFTRERPEVTPSKKLDDKIIPIKWSKEVLARKKQAVVKLAKRK